MTHADLNSLILLLLALIASYLLSRLSTTKTLSDRVNDLTNRQFVLQDELIVSRRREGDLKAELASVNARLRACEARTGITPPSVPGILIFDLAGIIREFSPSLTPTLKYLPKEVKGTAVTSLAAAEDGNRWSDAVAAVTADPAAADPAREILTYLRAKDGTAVPVAVSFEGWSGDGAHVTATIRRRASGGTPPGDSGRFRPDQTP